MMPSMAGTSAARRLAQFLKGPFEALDLLVSFFEMVLEARDEIPVGGLVDRASATPWNLLLGIIEMSCNPCGSRSSASFDVFCE